MSKHCALILLWIALLADCSVALANQPFSNNTGTLCIVVCDETRPTLAVWDDGVFLMWPLSNREGFCLIGRYDTNDVSQALLEVDNSGFLDLIRRDSVVPDSGRKSIYVRHGKKEKQRAWHRYLNPGFGGDLNSDGQYRQFVRAWLKTEGEITSLAPLEIHRFSEVKEVADLRDFRGVKISDPRKTEWPKPEGTSNHPSDRTR